MENPEQALCSEFLSWATLFQEGGLSDIWREKKFSLVGLTPIQITDRLQA